MDYITGSIERELEELEKLEIEGHGEEEPGTLAGGFLSLFCCWA